jgi:hypothetical protein
MQASPPPLPSTAPPAPRPLLPFQRRAVDELVRHDGLCVLAAGLGWAGVAGAVLRLSVERRRLPGQRGAAVVVGATDWQRDLVLAELADLMEEEGGGGGGPALLGGEPRPPAIAVVSADTPASLQAHLYASAGVVFATTRVLCVDLLSGVATGETVAGLFVLRAHRATAESGEAFAARLGEWRVVMDGMDGWSGVGWSVGERG